MSEEKTNPAETTEPKAPAGPAKLIRGRMPLPLVHYIRFNEVDTIEAEGENGETIKQARNSDSATAKKYFTTPGKIMDIRVNRNFKYLTAGTTFNQVDIDAAKEQLKKNIAEGKIRGAESPSHDFTEEDAAPMFELLDSLVSEKSSVEDDRKAYNEANPRTKKEKSDEVEPAETSSDATDPAEVEIVDGSNDGLEGLID